MASTPAPGGGRFLPGDPRVEEPYRLTPQLAFRLAILGFLALAMFAALFLRLWALQILSGAHYLAQANDNRVRTISIQAPRGPIVDRNGHVLVRNVPGTRVELWPADLPKRWPAERAELRGLSLVTGVPVGKLLAELRQSNGDPLTPIVVQSGLHYDQIYYLREHADQFPGVRLAESWLRKYPHQSLAAQVLGYVGQISPQEYTQLKKDGYQPTDTIGQAGVEASYDTYLRGRDGKADLTVDSRGRPKSGLTFQVLPQAGDTLRLTLDIGLQRAAERALTYGINLAHSNLDGQHADGGAIVAMDPRNGAILAMASNPTFEPSVFAGRPDPSKLDKVIGKEAVAADFPALNRAIDVGYPPGSTFKPVTALAAMQERLMQPNDLIPCTPTYTRYGQTFKNWTPYIDQPMTLTTALAESCDTYFYELGRRFYVLPPNSGHPLQEWASRFGIGLPTGVDIGPETSGLLPTPEWRRAAYPASKGYTEIDRTWKPGYSIQLAIGQGQLLVTPLQMTRLYAMIANGGKLVTPHVADDVEVGGTNGPTHVLRSFGAQPPESTGIDPTALTYVQRGLEEATHSPLGTGYGVFGSFPVDIAGKTGSAEKLISLPGYTTPQNLTQSWWCGYGPYQDPTIAVCAVIENGGHGGEAAAPAALKVFEQYFGHTTTPTAHPSD